MVLPEFIIKKNPEVNGLIKKFLELNKTRNRFIHPSAFQSPSETSELLPLLTITVEQVVDSLETCSRLVEIIDYHLPEELKILVWWNRVIHPNFKEYKKGSIVNPESLLSKIKYEDDYFTSQFR
ncbi:hypothetical protein [Peribacillus sp. TH24]|uniref:hypothetical protein n=1 Tax=Peribacillus sp. TH24 TaxID=2798483 RepID=UPI0019132BF2|nr:hypothetical protein [Peribacillus sp. TH24]MBK5444165.1 hypothetical protein [Peribacillus sp. TH24]